MGKLGRKPVLDEGKQREIAAIISLGCSQVVAARYVGCAVSTIQRTAERDSVFAARLGRARSNAEVGLVQNIRNAANKTQYWRAAAWALERFFPDDYSPRHPGVVTAAQIAQLLTQFADILVQQVPVERYRKNVVKAVAALVRSLGGDVRPESSANAPDSPAGACQSNSAPALVPAETGGTVLTFVARGHKMGLSPSAPLNPRPVHDSH